MNLKTRQFLLWQKPAAGTAGLVFLSLAALVLPFTREVENLSYDLPFLFRDEPPKEVLLVYMDDDSWKRLGFANSEFWDRAEHVKLLRQLAAYQARAIVFDVGFDQPWTSAPSVDVDFAKAIRSCNRVVLGAIPQTVEIADKVYSVQVQPPVEPLRSTAAWGVGDLGTEFRESAIRRLPPAVDKTGSTNLAWQAASIVGLVPPDWEKARWINYYCGEGLPHLKYYDALNPDARVANLISNRIVFVGSGGLEAAITSRGTRGDEHATPYTRWTKSKYPGVEILATVCENLIRRDWLTRLPPLVELALVSSAALVLAFALPRLRFGAASAAAAGVAVAAGAGGVLLALEYRFWFAWGVISFVEAPTALVWLAIVRLNQKPATGAPRSTCSTAGLEDETENGPPLVPEHKMLRAFAEGSYGQVWLAQSILGMYRAVKVVRRSTFEENEPFDREFRGIQAFEAVSRTHEGLVHVLQVGRNESAGYFYYVMELADDLENGQAVDPVCYVPWTLSKHLERSGGQLPCRECVHIGIVLTGALQYLQTAGLVHRDIKPSNIIFVRGSPKLADIGLVTQGAAAKSFVGTEGFMAPEGPGSHQADIYSLGKVLYEISMGRDRTCFPELPTNLTENPDGPFLAALNEILLRACHPSTGRRYSTAEKMLADLNRLAKKMQTGKKPKEAE